MKHLVIVESPTKARTISRFLGKDYEIKFSMGHVMDLPKSKLGVDVDASFEPQYELVSDKKKIIAELKRSARGAERIILATDPDREGEAIASHVKDMLGENQKSKIKNQRYQRIVFHEITKEAIDEALKNPRSIDTHLVNAQTARRVLDRLVGYKLSPMLWRKVRRGLSAGRVQSVALRLIVEREREIEKFKKESYFTVTALLAQGPEDAALRSLRQFGARGVQGSPRPLNDSSNSDLKQSASLARANASENVANVALFKSSFRGEARPSPSTEFELIEINGEKIELQKSFQLYDGEYKITKTTIEKEDQAKKIVDDLKTKKYIVTDVIQKETHRSPQPPYTTSTLQQDAARRLFLNGKRTMSLAQKLYEEGYITYHRTDSVSIGSAAMFSIINFVKKEFGEKYVPEKPRFYKTRQKLAQEAHEAIRPTAVAQILNIKYQISNMAGEQGWRLYELIWRRAVASQMSDAVIESTTVVVDARGPATPFPPAGAPASLADAANAVRASGSPSSRVTPRLEDFYKLKANGSVLVFGGFLKVNPLGLQDRQLPKFKTSEKLDMVDLQKEFHETPPPPRYNDASLIKTLEEKGIGRPSTYASIVSTIESRLYIERAEGRFIPTSVGIAVNDFLVTNFSTIDDIPFTALMEDELDEVANGKKEWQPMMKEFYAPFEKKLEEVQGADRVKIAVEKTDEVCPECKQGNLVIRTGRFGKFLSCSRFPECKLTKSFVEKTNLTCPKDGAQIVIKKTRKGRRFYGCSNYPKCDFAAWKIEDIKKHE